MRSWYFGFAKSHMKWGQPTLKHSSTVRPRTASWGKKSLVICPSSSGLVRFDPQMSQVLEENWMRWTFHVVQDPLRKEIECENIHSVLPPRQRERKKRPSQKPSRMLRRGRGAMFTGDPALHGHPKIQITELRHTWWPSDNSIQARQLIQCYLYQVSVNEECRAGSTNCWIQDQQRGRLALGYDTSNKQYICCSSSSKHTCWWRESCSV